MTFTLSKKELQLLRILQKGGRRKQKDIAQEVGVSEATLSKMRAHLVAEGVILKDGVAILNPKKLGFEVAFFKVDCRVPEYVGTLQAILAEWPEIQEIYRLFGDMRSLLLKVLGSDPAQISECRMQICNLEGVQGVHADLVMTHKWTNEFPI